MNGISMNDVSDLKDGDLIKTKYLSHDGEILDSQIIIFREAFVRGKNMVVINYNVRESKKVKNDNPHLYEMTNIISIKKI